MPRLLAPAALYFPILPAPHRRTTDAFALLVTYVVKRRITGGILCCGALPLSTLSLPLAAFLQSMSTQLDRRVHT